MNPNPAPPRQVQAGGLLWRLRCAGPAAGEAPTLLLLHGTGSSALSWQGCVPALAAHFHVVMPDLPGHGGTSAFADRQAGLPRMAQAVGRLLEVLGHPPELIAGHSAGAALMAQLVLDGHAPQVRGLLALNGALEPLPGLLGWVAPAAARLAARSAWVPGWVTRHASEPGAVQHLIAATGSRLGGEAEAHYAGLLRQPTHVRGVLDMLATWRVDELASRLPRLRVPLWLAAGLHDRSVAPRSSRELAQRLPNARFVPLPGLGHLAHEEDPAACVAVLLALWDQVRGAATADTAACTSREPPCGSGT